MIFCLFFKCFFPFLFSFSFSAYHIIRSFLRSVCHTNIYLLFVQIFYGQNILWTIKYLWTGKVLWTGMLQFTRFPFYSLFCLPLVFFVQAKNANDKRKNTARNFVSFLVSRSPICIGLWWGCNKFCY